MTTTATGHEEIVGLTAQAATVEVFDFRDIYEQHFDFVWRVARRLGVADSLLDDATQDVFVVVHRRLGDFEGRSTVKSWIYGITRRVAKDYRRRASRKDRGKVPADETLVDRASSGPDTRAAHNEAVALLYRLLDELDEQKREVFVLAELGELTVPEIADAIDVNVNTVYSRLRAARAAFEKQVARHHARSTRQQECLP